VTDRQELYGLPLERFVPERGALAKELRKQGRREEAVVVAALRKPSVAAWAVNQLVRSQNRDIEALFAAGDELQHAQTQLLAGHADGHALRAAVEHERGAVDTLVGKARGLLSAGGHELTQAALERVSETLHAAALDEDARAQVKDGCLERELRHVGLGGGGAVAARVSPSRPPARAAASKRDAAEAKRAQRERTDRLKAARQAEADARRAADRANRDLHTAQRRRDEAESAFKGAEQALAAAREQAERAVREHERARQALALGAADGRRDASRESEGS
jgi:hypothetical protein